LLAANVVTFLTAWEGVCYLGPDDAGYLDAESERAARLRELFRTVTIGLTCPG